MAADVEPVRCGKAGDCVIPVLWWMSSLLSILTAVATRLTLPLMLPQIARAGFVAVNYKGRAVPAAAGTIPVVVYTVSLFFWLLVPVAAGEAALRVYAQALLLATLAFALIGFMDDVFGDRTAVGLRGHWRRLLEGELTTGGLKAIFGAVTAIAVAGVVSRGFGQLLLNAVIIALSANAVNLFDLRPGRALKLFFVGVALLFAVEPRQPLWIIVTPPIAAVAAYAPEDLRGRAMLGDAGANALGATLGVAAAVMLSWPLKVIVAFLLVVLHVGTERASISGIIERVPLLRRLDEWGRS